MQLKRVLFAVGATVCFTKAAAGQTLRGSPGSVDLMYTTARGHDLAFLQTSQDVYEAAVQGALKLISISEDLTLDRVSYPFVLPSTLRFADSLAHEYRAGCGERLIVTSGSRPTDEQPRNASPKSVHPTGMAVDFHKPSGACLTWLRKNLTALEKRHVVEATEERHPAHFHVAVLSQNPEGDLRLASADGTRTTKSGGDIALAPNGGASSTTSGPSTYRVRAGDNLWTIARRHNTTSKALQALNGMRTTRLRVGQTLRLSADK